MKKEGSDLILQRILEAAYRAFDPQAALKSIVVTRTLLDKLLPEATFADARELNNPPTLCKDLLNYRAQRDTKQWDDDALFCQFVYFATSMIHVFPRGGGCVSYIQPNTFIPYVWINVIDAENVALVNYCSRIEKDIFRVIMHVVRSLNEISTVKKSIQLRNGGLVISFSQGNAIQLCLRLDLEQPQLTMTAANPSLPNCVVLLSYRGEFVSAWQKGKERLMCAVHDT